MLAKTSGFRTAEGSSSPFSDISERIETALDHLEYASTATSGIYSGAEGLEGAAPGWASDAIADRGRTIGRLSLLVDHHLVALRAIITGVKDALPEALVTDAVTAVR